MGVDQIAARVSGMCEWNGLRLGVNSGVIAVRVGPGPSNKGIFVRINRDGPGKGEVSLEFRGKEDTAETL